MAFQMLVITQKHILATVYSQRLRSDKGLLYQALFFVNNSMRFLQSIDYKKMKKIKGKKCRLLLWDLARLVECEGEYFKKC